MPIGKLAQTAGKGADYSAGSVNIEHGASGKLFPAPSRIPGTNIEYGFARACSFPFLTYICTGKSKALSGYQKTSSEHTYGAGALNIAATTDVPKVKENLSYAKSELAGQSQYGSGAVNLETAINAPKIKHEGLGQVDKKQ